MKKIYYILLFFLLLLLNSCVTKFTPQTSEDKEILVVEGLISDKPGTNIIKLSKSMPLGGSSNAKPVSGWVVAISDELGNSVSFDEKDEGTYTPPSFFHGEIGRSYTLHLTDNTTSDNLRYESFPMKMKPVPEIDSVFYEKKIIVPQNGPGLPKDGCQIYVNTYDPTNSCKFYRWEYSETWEFSIPYNIKNKTCWLSTNSTSINIKNTSVLEEDRITRYPLNYISNETDRLKVKYSILVNQYSLNEDEYLYYIIPSSIPSNVYCTGDPNQKVLGYFSVSASTSKRIFIKDNFNGVIDMYKGCGQDTLFNFDPIPNLNSTVWILIEHQMPPPAYRVITYSKGCADCTVRGSNTPPDFWKEGK
jgi:hypothetical protein